MKIDLPLPHLKSKGLEDGYRQHHESGADETRAYGFLMTLVHTVDKSSKKNEE